MSATKLIIRKFEAGGVICKLLRVTAGDDESDSSKTTYSDWIEENIQGQKHDADKSSRLIVKIVSKNEIDRFNLASSAKDINVSNSKITNLAEYLVQQKICHDLYNSADGDGQAANLNVIDTHLTGFQKQYPAQDKYSLYSKEYLSPLEYSLEKVQENNARIMENIHLLNRTLSYTKKKEIFNIVCPSSMTSYPCNTCGKCFVYETGLRRHYSMRHAMEEVPRWQVVWTCIQCFQVWPRLDQAMSHSSECCKSNNRECVREIKTSSLLQCEFCEKVYTSIPRLLSHSKTHTTSNNYECNACELAFSTYKMVEQHWMSCPWLKMYYSFSLPKLFLCNACDRKFRNYEQLYNHRYKAGHFMTKIPNQYNIKTLGILVYQCELCGAWYPSLAPLKAHRNQYHQKHDTAKQCKMENNSNEQDYSMSAENVYYINNSEDGYIQEQ